MRILMELPLPKTHLRQERLDGTSADMGTSG